MFSFFDRNPIGRLITRTTSDIEALSDLLSNGVVNIIGDVFRIVFILFFMFSLSWELSLISLITPAGSGICHNPVQKTGSGCLFECPRSDCPT